MKTQALPTILPFHPKPIGLHVAHMPMGDGQVVTSIVRRWREGATAGCRLCLNCGARDNVCLVLVDQYVPREEADAFSTRGLVRVPGDLLK